MNVQKGQATKDSAPSNTKTSPEPKVTTAAETPSQNEEDSETEEIEESGLKVSWIVERYVDDIDLHSNLNEKLTSDQAISTYSCLNLVTAGFYSDQNGHIGLFIDDGVILSEEVDHKTFNGYFSITGNRPLISRQPPVKADEAVQAGPLLILNDEVLEFKSNQERSRRVIAATNRLGNVIFITFYDGANRLYGPSLSELPGLLKDLEDRTSIDIYSAINLDGGSHSAFISEELKLKELSTMGSYFCF